MASERTDELYKVLLDRGYPKEFCAEITCKNINTDYTATRMLEYLLQAQLQSRYICARTACVDILRMQEPLS